MPSLLLLEDNPNLRLGLRVLFELEGVEVAEAGTLAEGVTSLNNARPDAAIVDVLLPDGSGLEFSDRLRRQWPDCPVFLLTALTSLPPARPFVHVRPKPFDPAQLVDDVLAAAGLPPSTRADRAPAQGK
jgi:CheY-like chemotaxis protein